jgi:hypothetical protein
MMSHGCAAPAPAVALVILHLRLRFTKRCLVLVVVALAAARLFHSTIAMSASSYPLRVLVTASGTVGSHILRALTSPAYKSRITAALLVRNATLKVRTTVQHPRGGNTAASSHLAAHHRVPAALHLL